LKVKKSENLEIKQRAQYWEAETNYRLKNYKGALTKFIFLKKLIKTNFDNKFPLTDYNIGYCHFKLKEYEEASIAFNKFLKKDSLENTMRDDALIRLGDSYFAIRNYTEASISYKKVVDKTGSGSDYAQYQIGMGYGLNGDNNEKINALNKVVNNFEFTTLKDDALYQLANTYTLIKNNEKAHLAYNRLIDKYPKSIFIPKALVRQGLLYYNDDLNEKALEKFKKTTSDFPNSPDALEAVANARNIYIDNGNIDEYLKWVRTLNFINITNSDLDNTSFAFAEKKYFESQNENNIINSLLKYTRSFPDGIHKLKANYYLAETFYKVNEFEKAILSYQIVLEEEQNEFSEESLNKLSQIYLSKEEFDFAIALLDRLEQEAYKIENIMYAQSNLMKSYFEIEAYDIAIEYAKKNITKR
jgi:TolA-binding protein